MDDFKSNDNKKILDLLKEQTENTQLNEEIDAQTTNGANSEDDIKNLLKQQFFAERTEPVAISDDYSIDTEDFVMTGEIELEKAQTEQETTMAFETVEEAHKDTEEEEIEEIETDLLEEPSEELELIEEVEAIKEDDSEEIEETEGIEESEKMIEEELSSDPVFNDQEEERVDVGGIFEPPAAYTQISFEEEHSELPISESENEESVDPVEKVVQEILSEADDVAQETVEEISEIKAEYEVVEATMPFEPVASLSDTTNVFGAINKEVAEDFAPVEEKDELNTVEATIQEAITEKNSNDEEPLSEESINYDEVLEGQQGTVFNSFVEDFTGDLDDVVFEAEITASQAPEKQYTIFEDWEQMMKEKEYETAEEGIIPPTPEELAYSAEIAARAANGNTDYFTPITPDSELDAVDIALMAALGGNEKIDETVDFEKIRQAVKSTEGEDSSINTHKSIYGFCGEEYNSILQTGKIKKKYNIDKKRLHIKTLATAIITLLLILYEFSGWMGRDLLGTQKAGLAPVACVLIGLGFLTVAIVISCSKIKDLMVSMLESPSISYIGALALSLISIVHDILVLAIRHVEPTQTIHSLAAILLLISLIYDNFELHAQAGVFDIVSRSNKKLVLEPYGKIRIGENDGEEDMIDKDSYCISRVTNVKGFFARMSRSVKNTTGKLVTLVLSFSVSFCVMLGLLLAKESIANIVLGLVITLSFSIICASVFESEFAFFTVYKILKKYKTGIVGRASIEEYGKCNIIYFDDYNVFNKKSVRTKGLKLYNNDEIYRILYHTQAVFSKIGGPLKGVFEFATTEMIHSKNVEIKHIGKDGISALVDNRTTVLIGSGSFMKRWGIHPSYTSADLVLEESGEESIVFIALNGTLGAKLYVTYQFSAEFERLAKKLTSCGIGIGIRSSDPSINDRWAKVYGAAKKCSISIVRPNLKELKLQDKPTDSGVVSAKNVRAISEALMMCTRLYSFEALIAKVRMVAIVLVGVLTFILVRVSGINAVSLLLLLLECALGASVMMLLSHFYIKR